MSQDEKLTIIGRETGVSLGLIVVLIVAAASTFAWIRVEFENVRNETTSKVREVRLELQGRIEIINAKLDSESEASTRSLIIIERVDKRTQQIEAELRLRSSK